MQEEGDVAVLTIRNVDEGIKHRLRVRAAEHGRSMEAEVRAILESALEEPERADLFTAILEQFASLGGVDLDLPERDAARKSPTFP